MSCRLGRSVVLVIGLFLARDALSQCEDQNEPPHTVSCWDEPIQSFDVYFQRWGLNNNGAPSAVDHSIVDTSLSGNLVAYLDVPYIEELGYGPYGTFGWESEGGCAVKRNEDSSHIIRNCTTFEVGFSPMSLLGVYPPNQLAVFGWLPPEGGTFNATVSLNRVEEWYGPEGLESSSSIYGDGTGAVVVPAPTSNSCNGSIQRLEVTSNTPLHYQGEAILFDATIPAAALLDWLGELDPPATIAYLELRIRRDGDEVQFEQIPITRDGDHRLLTTLEEGDHTVEARVSYFDGGAAKYWCEDSINIAFEVLPDHRPSLAGLQVIQVVQDMHNTPYEPGLGGVPLIADKTTYVRAYVEPNPNGSVPVQPLLFASVDGGEEVEIGPAELIPFLTFEGVKLPDTLPGLGQPGFEAANG
ncbi:MAG: hypothetical protein KC561_19795, partial [Myxococcales bacterium]|nr:hypothetical protein [Myxococcales bacterium]